MSMFTQIHPLLVHFPVALLVSGTLFEIYGRIQKEDTVVMAGWFNLRFGTVMAAVTAGVGLLGVLGLEIRDAFRSFLSFHVSFALVTLVLFVTALVVHRFFTRPWVRITYHVLLILGLFSVLATGYCGGELVHRFGVATLQPVE